MKIKLFAIIISSLLILSCSKDDTLVYGKVTSETFKSGIEKAHVEVSAVTSHSSQRLVLTSTLTSSNGEYSLTVTHPTQGYPVEYYEITFSHSSYEDKVMEVMLTGNKQCVNASLRMKEF